MTAFAIILPHVQKSIVFMKFHHWMLIGIVIVGLLTRLILLNFTDFPGINDPNHYYNLGLRLLDGHGFTMDYLWHFNFMPQTLQHPFDFWQPLAGILAYFGMLLLGEGVAQAIIPFIVLGSFIPLVTYLAARQLECSQGSSLFVAACAAFLPELLLNSLRTDTLIPNALAIGLMMICLIQGLKRGQWWLFVMSGIFAGFGYMTRGDNLLLLPMLVVSLTVYAIWGRKDFVHRKSWYLVWLTPLIAIVVISPWLMRNLNVLGQWSSTPSLSKLLYFSDFRDHYHYDREFSLDTLLEERTPSQLVSKRIFEATAAIRMMITTLDGILPAAIVGGLLLILWNRDKQRLFTLLPVVILLGGMYFAYTILVPIANQGGSFKKSYLTLVPLLLPLAAHALDTVITNKAFKHVTFVIVVLLVFQSGIMLVAEDIRFTENYLRFLRQVDTTLSGLPDTNNDDDIVIMAQDPFALRYLGYRSVQIPMEDRDTILDVVSRYHVDYILFPSARPSLDGIYEGSEEDARFIPVAEVNPAAMIYSFDFDVVESVPSDE